MSEHFLSLKTREDLHRLVEDGYEEGLTLEYKASSALTRSSEAITELCKDVSAMANSAGGQIVYGVEENRQTKKPECVDHGVVDSKITREWIIQILNSHIQPRIHGVTIDRIPLSGSGGPFGFVINIPSTHNGPHQAPDKKYYRRFELHSVPMEDYEIRDVMGRSTTAVLEMAFYFDGMKDSCSLQYVRDQDDHIPVGLTPTIVNTSNAPALYVVASVLIDAQLTVLSTKYENRGKTTTAQGIAVAAYSVTFNAAHQMPIFKEQPMMLPNLGLIVPETVIFRRQPFYIGYEVRAPGCFRSGSGEIEVESANIMRIRMQT
jgi:Putative DNA-binding domain